MKLVDSPNWFASKIDLSGIDLLVTFDDDSSIHQVWKKRISNFENSSIVHKHFYSFDDFRQFVKSNFSKIGQIKFLVDYEFINQKKTGLEVIEELEISKHSILVTSRYDEKLVQQKAELIGLKLLPKSLSGEVPLTRHSSKIKYDMVLIDDDVLVRTTWEIRAKKRGKSILVLSTSEELRAMLTKLDFDSVFYIDVHLGKNESGLDLSYELYELGYKNLYLATGYEEDDFQNIYWIKGIVGKAPA